MSSGKLPASVLKYLPGFKPKKGKRKENQGNNINPIEETQDIIGKLPVQKWTKPINPFDAREFVDNLPGIELDDFGADNFIDPNKLMLSSALRQVRDDAFFEARNELAARLGEGNFDEVSLRAEVNRLFEEANDAQMGEFGGDLFSRLVDRFSTRV